MAHPFICTQQMHVGRTERLICFTGGEAANPNPWTQETAGYKVQSDKDLAACTHNEGVPKTVLGHDDLDINEVLVERG